MLNDTAYRFLKRNGRTFKMSRPEVIDAFAAIDMEAPASFVEFQIQFGGYRLDDDLTYGLFYPSDLGLQPTQPRIDTRGDQTFIRCDLKNLSQIVYELDDSGMYYEDRQPVAESFVSMVAFTSYLDSALRGNEWTHIPNDRLSTKRYRGFFDRSKLTRISTASDSFHSVSRNDEILYVECGHYEPRLFVLPHVAKRIR